MYETMRVERLLDAIKDEFSGEELPSLEQIMRSHPDWQLDRDVLEREYHKLSARLLDARRFVSEHADRIDLEDLLDVKEWLRKWDLDIGQLDFDLLEQEYFRYGQRMLEIARERRRRESARGLPFSIGLDSLDWVSLPHWVRDPAAEQLRLHEMRREDEQLARVKELIHDISLQLAVTGSRRDHLRSQLAAFRYPRHWQAGLYILVFFATVGIVLPLILIAVPCDELYPSLAAAAVIFLFAVGLAAVFAYMWYQLRSASAPVAIGGDQE